MLVVNFHAFPEAMPGGFIGVDVFFVISGFLITGIIVRELDQQRFSLLGFYQRRIRRIFPALIGPTAKVPSMIMKSSVPSSTSGSASGAVR